MMLNIFEEHMFVRPLRRIADIENAAATFRTFFEERRPQKKQLEMATLVCEEIESEILRLWPSKNAEKAEQEQISLAEFA